MSFRPRDLLSPSAIVHKQIKKELPYSVVDVGTQAELDAWKTAYESQFSKEATAKRWSATRQRAITGFNNGSGHWMDRPNKGEIPEGLIYIHSKFTLLQKIGKAVKGFFRTAFPSTY